MVKYKPTPETTKFAAEAIRVSALIKAGLSTDQDMKRLESMAAAAKTTQEKANEGR